MARLSETHISTLISAGADAMSNMYEVEFIPPAGFYSDIAPKLKIRTKSFTPPAPKQKDYDVHWKTVSVKRPATKIELERTLEFEIRVDSNYNVYKCLLEWQSYTSIASVGFAANSLKYATGKIIVRALDTTITGLASDGAVSDIPSDTSMKWVFEDVWLPEITPPQFTTEDAEAQVAVAKFNYGNYEDPQTIVAELNS